MFKYHIITIGCQMNRSDSEKIAGYLEKRGWSKTDLDSQADVVIITTCGIKQSAEDRVYGLIPAIKRRNEKAKIIITGCLSQRSDVIRRLKDRVDIWLPIQDLPKLGEKLNLENENSDINDYLQIKAKRENSHSAFVPIGNGCNNFCSYCVVPYARGREKYRDHQEIITEIKDLLNQGYKEINLIAQNVNSYVSPSDNKISFTKLLKLIENLPEYFWISFFTSHPKDISDELIDFIGRSQKLCESLHLPAQAGNNRILELMNRKYTIEHYKNLISKIRKVKPNISITTDIIVGFPGETEDEFNDTVKLFQEVGFDMAYISKFSPRPETTAYKMEDNVAKEEKKRRERELVSVLRQTFSINNKKYLGQEIEVIIEDQSDHQYYYGRTKTNRDIKFPKSGNNLIIGSLHKVKINQINNFSLLGEIIN